MKRLCFLAAMTSLAVCSVFGALRYFICAPYSTEVRFSSPTSASIPSKKHSANVSGNADLVCVKVSGLKPVSKIAAQRASKLPKPKFTAAEIEMQKHFVTAEEGERLYKEGKERSLAQMRREFDEMNQSKREREQGDPRNQSLDTVVGWAMGRDGMPINVTLADISLDGKITNPALLDKLAITAEREAKVQNAKFVPEEVARLAVNRDAIYAMDSLGSGKEDLAFLQAEGLLDEQDVGVLRELEGFLR